MEKKKIEFPYGIFLKGDYKCFALCKSLNEAKQMMKHMRYRQNYEIREIIA